MSTKNPTKFFFFKVFVVVFCFYWAVAINVNTWDRYEYMILFWISFQRGTTKFISENIILQSWAFTTFSSICYSLQHLFSLSLLHYFSENCNTLLAICYLLKVYHIRRYFGRGPWAETKKKKSAKSCWEKYAARSVLVARKKRLFIHQCCRLHQF
jgi:hypothetical protein